MGKFRDVYFLKKSILSAVLCFWIAYLKACDKGSGLSPCICGNCDPELPLGMGRAFRIALQAETTAQFLAPERDTFSGTVHVRRCIAPFRAPLVELRYS